MSVFPIFSYLLLLGLFSLSSLVASTKPPGCTCVPLSPGGSCYYFTNAPRDLYWLDPKHKGPCMYQQCKPKYVCSNKSSKWCIYRPVKRVVVPTGYGNICQIKMVNEKQLVPYGKVRDGHFRKPKFFHLFFAGDTNCWIFHRGKHVADCNGYKTLTVIKDMELGHDCAPVVVRLLDRTGARKGFIAGVDAEGHMIGSYSKHVRISLKYVSNWSKTSFNPSKWSKGLLSKEMTDQHKDLSEMTGARGVTWKPGRKNQSVYIIISLKKFCQAPYY